ncbi:hypothetical protein DRO35_03600 [Candidatus Bathyarchaeota archaeon]|nr:MAG: hypothetical protein DRO35_03600 [Candidatus Bathyarchaeota archaeon]
MLTVRSCHRIRQRRPYRVEISIFNLRKIHSTAGIPFERRMLALGTFLIGFAGTAIILIRRKESSSEKT